MKFKVFFLVLPLMSLLAACQTTGINTAAAPAVPYGVTPADAQMSCAQMQAEFAQLDQIITAAGNSTINNQMTTTGTQAARDLAYASGAQQSTGWINGLSNLARNMTTINAQQQQQQVMAAQNRRNQLLNLAQQKGCM